MRIRNKIASAKAIFKTKLFSARTPLIVSWHLLNRCNRKCKYCYRWTEKTKELSTAEIYSTIDRLREMGTQIILFSGGEPLLREDIGGIVDYGQAKNIFMGLTSNGDLVAQKIAAIRNLDLLKLSFEGPPEVHDLLRGKGSYSLVMSAVEVAKKCNINVKFNTTLTKYNIDYLDFVLQKAAELEVKVKFNPVTFVHSMGVEITSLFPEKEKYKQAIQKLLCLKKVNPYIINSATALKYLSGWPVSSGLKCYAGKLICCIAPNGDVYPCSLLRDKVKPFNCLDNDFTEAFYRSSLDTACGGCWCTSTLELNCLLSFKPEVVLNIDKMFKR